MCWCFTDWHDVGTELDFFNVDVEDVRTGPRQGDQGSARSTAPCHHEGASLSSPIINPYRPGSVFETTTHTMSRGEPRLRRRAPRISTRRTKPTQ
jgi:hypothetical protein